MSAVALPQPARRLGRLAWPALFVAVGVLAFSVRLLLLLHGGGPLGIGAYDDGVHYAAADALVHGLIPYRDFLFLQPPAILVAVAPFALLGRALGDPTALVALRIAFELVGAANAVLVAANLRRFGLPAAVAGGVFYAVFFPAVFDERTALLEPLGTAGVLAALLLVGLVQDARLPVSWLLLAGAALGVAVGMKVWYLISLLVILVFAGAGRRGRLLLGAAAAGGIVSLPFFLLAPVDSFRQIVLDQLGRGRGATSIATRLASVLGVDGAGPYSTVPQVSAASAAVLAAGVVGALVTVTVRERRAWPYLALFGIGVPVVLAAPSYFEHYAALTAAPLAIVVGVAAGRLDAALRTRPQRVVALSLIVVAVLAVNMRRDSEPQGSRVPVAALTAAVAKVRGCILADDPTVLAVLNVLTRDYDAGCRVQPDMSGVAFDPAGLPAGTAKIQRERNPVYQALARRYLRSGAAFLVVRGEDGLNRATRAALARNAVLFGDGRWVLRVGETPR